MKKLFSWLLIACLMVLSSSCLRLPFQSTPEQQLQQLITKHPGLSRPDTIKVQVPVVVPAVEFRTKYVPVRDTVWLQQESSRLDTLINKLQSSLDSTQQAATKAKLHQLLIDRPVLRDTLCFDTLGVKGRIWLQNQTYQIQITREAIRDTARKTVAVQKLQGCPPAAEPHFAWYDPAGLQWPWWAWLLLGAGLGVMGGIFLCTQLIRINR